MEQLGRHPGAEVPRRLGRVWGEEGVEGGSPVSSAFVDKYDWAEPEGS